MKKFLAIYVGTPDAFEKSGWNKLDPAARKARETAGIKAWMDWGAAHSKVIVDQGSPLGKTKRMSPDGVTDIRNNVAGYVVVRAETQLQRQLH